MPVRIFKKRLISNSKPLALDRKEYARFLNELALCDVLVENYQGTLESQEPLVDTVRKYLIEKDPNAGVYLNALGKTLLVFKKGRFSKML